MRHPTRFVTLALVAAGALLAALRPASAQPAAPHADQPASAAAANNPQVDAFFAAARKGDAAAVKTLLDQGVDVNSKFRYGTTALFFACDHGHLDVVRVLLERGADPNVKDTFYGATPLSWASSPAQTRKPQHAEIVGLLLKHGAKGASDALLAAVREGDEPMTRIVLASGGLSAQNLTDALETATHEKQDAIVTLLQQAGAKPAPVVTLTEAQLARCAGSFVNGTTTLTFAVKDGKLQGGPPGQTLTLVPRSETTFGVAGSPGLSLTCAPGEKAASVTVTRGDSPTVYTRVEGK